MAHSGYFNYNHTSHKQLLRNATFLKKYGWWHKSIYLYLDDDHKKHLIPNLDTMEYLRAMKTASLNQSAKNVSMIQLRYMNNVVSLASEDFDEIQEGEPIRPVSYR